MIRFRKAFGLGGALIGLLLAVVALSGCKSPSGGVPDGDVALMATNTNTPAPPSEVLQPGDSLNITYGDLPVVIPPFDGQIKSDGTITLIENQLFHAAGKTKGQLEEEIRKRYVPDYYTKMTVTINVKTESRWYFVGGEVRQPGARPYLSRISVLKAIQSAGDFTEFANKKNVVLTRANGKQIKLNVLSILRNPSQDVEVYPGDSIHVKRKWW